MFNKFLIKATPEQIISLFPEEIENVLHRSDRYLQKQISFTHPKDMEQCTTEVLFTGDWEHVPFSDIEWCYVLNRHRFIEELALAYFITKEEKYYNGFRDYLIDWIVQNPNPKARPSTTWRRIETGIRIIHWTKAIELVSYHRKIDNEDLELIKNSLLKHGEYLITTKNAHSHTSNWGAIEFRGLAVLGAFYPCETTKGWVDLAKEHLINMLHQTTLSDGVHWECSPTYHYEVNASYLTLMLVCKHLGIQLEDNVQKEIQKMSTVNALWQKPNFNQPQWGDSDDTDNRDVISLAAWIFKDSKLKSRAYPQLDLENYLLLGEVENQKYKEIDCENFPLASSYLKEGGLLCLRDSWGEDSLYLSFNSKKYVATHGHDDLLHVSFYAKQKDYLIDCGRYTYMKERQEFAFSKGHNTIIINGRENSLYREKWSNVEAYFLQGEWQHQNGIDWAYSHNLAYMDDGIVITRNLIKFNSHSFLILDSILGNKDKTIELKFNTPCKIQQENEHFKLDDLNFVPDPNVQCSLQKAWYSPHYNEKIESDQLLLKMSANTDTTIASLFSFDKVRWEYIPIFNRAKEEIPSDIATGLRIFIGKEEFVVIYRLRQDISKGTGNHGPFMLFEGGYYIPSKIVLKKEKDTYKELIMIN